MRNLMVLIVLVGVLIIAGLYLAGELKDKEAQLFYGRAHLVEVQSEARKDLLAGLMPYTVLGLGVIFGGTIVSILALIVFALLFVKTDDRGHYTIRRIL